MSDSILVGADRPEGWYLNPFDCGQQMYWTGSGWTRRRTSEGNERVPLGFPVRSELRDATIRNRINRLNIANGHEVGLND